MPFVTREHRLNPDYAVPGDRCFAAYKKIIEMWTANPRWTEVDKIAESIWPKPWERAFVLAFLVFFCKVVMPYEDGKEKENGGVHGV